jgi:HD-like signal output (HDOD) protein
MPNDNLALLEKYGKSIKLSSLSANIYMLMTKLADSEINLSHLAELIKTYPEIVLRLIYLANSAWSAPLTPITTVEQACLRLGIGIVRSVSIALAVSSHFNASRCPGFRTVRFWSTAMLTAEGVGLIVAQFPPELKNNNFRECAQTAGILHSLGLLWLAENYPDATSEALQKTMIEPSLSLADALDDILGLDYCIVGGWIGARMGIPESLRVPMQYHRDTAYRGPFWEINLTVGAAARLANALQENTDADFLFITDTGGKPNLPPVDQRGIFNRLGANLPKTRELAELLF